MARAATRARVPRRQRGGQSHHAHWRAPASMLACLLAGTAFAIGHHYFNESLKGHTAKTASVRIAWFHVSRQQFNFTVGTAFAFLVQSALTASVSTAYSQLFWRRIRKHPQTELSTMDTLFAGVSSPYGLFKVMVWWREPLLFVMAITFWCASAIRKSSVITANLLNAKAHSLRLRLHPRNIVRYSGADLCERHECSPVGRLQELQLPGLHTWRSKWSRG